MMGFVFAGETIENVDDERTKRLPDTLIYGVRKGGTRALLEFLDINPKIGFKYTLTLWPM